MLAEDTDSVSVVSIPSPSSLATVCTSRTGRSVFRRSLKVLVAGFETAGPERYLLMFISEWNWEGYFLGGTVSESGNKIVFKMQGKVKKKEKARYARNTYNSKMQPFTSKWPFQSKSGSEPKLDWQFLFQ